MPFGEKITVKGNIYDDSSNSYESLLKITIEELIRGGQGKAIFTVKLEVMIIRFLTHQARDLLYSIL